MSTTNRYADGSAKFQKALIVRFPDRLVAARRTSKIDAEDQPRLVTFEVDEIERPI